MASSGPCPRLCRSIWLKTNIALAASSCLLKYCILPFENDVWNHLFRLFRRRESKDSVDKPASLYQNPEEAKVNLDLNSCNSWRLALGLQVFAALVGATVQLGLLLSSSFMRTREEMRPLCRISWPWPAAASVSNLRTQWVAVLVKSSYFDSCHSWDCCCSAVCHSWDCCCSAVCHSWDSWTRPVLLTWQILMGRLLKVLSSEMAESKLIQ